MAHDIAIKDGYVFIRLSGQLTIDDLSAVMRRLDEIESTSDKSLHRFTDISAVEDIALNFASLQDFTEKRQAARLQNKVRSAVVTATPVQFGFARMFQLLSRQPLSEVAVFRDADSALQWILGKA